MAVTDFPAAIKLLSSGRVEFIIVGGVAATIHGSAHITFDLDVVYCRSSGNIERLATTLESIHPYLRGAPPGLPFHFDAPTITRGLNFTLETTLGDLDLLGEVTGGGTYEQLLPDTITGSIDGVEFHCVTLARLIALKRAAGRPKDLNILAELVALLEEQAQGE